MFLARVIGKVVATVKDETLNGRALLIVEPLNENLEVTGKPFIAVDGVGNVGYGDIIYWEGGREAPMAVPFRDAPVDAAIVGIVDELQSVRPWRGEQGKRPRRE
jgi:microcompartment protein CcmK/EutM